MTAKQIKSLGDTLKKCLGDNVKDFDEFWNESGKSVTKEVVKLFKEKGTKAKKTKKQKEDGAPKGVCSAYIFFSTQRRKELKEKNKDKKVDNNKILKQIGTEWKELSDEDKKPFQELAKKDKERYQNEKKEFEEKKKNKKDSDKKDSDDNKDDDNEDEKGKKGKAKPKKPAAKKASRKDSSDEEDGDKSD